MANTFGTRLTKAWNVFREKDESDTYYSPGDVNVSYIRPDRPRFTRGNERSIVTSIYNRIAVDVAALTFNHVRLDENGRFKEVIDSPLNRCLNLSANWDQTGRAFVQDTVMSLLDEGCIACIPTDTTDNPEETGSYDIDEMRVGEIIDWYPDKIKASVYNERKNIKEEIVISKTACAIIENPLYAVINEPNSTLKRLIRKLNLLDYIDEQSGSGKLDLIIQLPYTIKSQTRMDQAEKRRKQIEEQLQDTKYGIAYVDATEKITQLNRSLENNLLKTIEYLTNMLYGQLGISAGILDGTADEKQMLNYQNKIIEPISAAIVNEYRRKFLTPTARAQGQDIMVFSSPFRLVPVNDIAEIADKFTRNEIMTSNEIRQVIGMKPSDDPKADRLINSNISQSSEELKRMNGKNNSAEENGDNWRAKALDP